MTDYVQPSDTRLAQTKRAVNSGGVL